MYRTILPIFLAALGVGYIAMVVRSEGTALGFEHVVNDPGKVIFHVALLPTAAWFLAKGLPISLIAKAFTSYRFQSVVCMLVLLLAGIILNLGDAYDSVYSRPAAPFDIKQQPADLLKLYAKLQDGHAAILKQEKWSGPSTPNLPPECNYPVEPKREEWSRWALTCYMSELKKYTNKQEPDNEIKKPYLEVASWQSVAGVGLSMVGTMFILVVLWITALYVITNTKFNERSFNTMAVVSGVVIFWIPLRIYSEWYLNFGYYEKSNYSTLYIANVVAVVWFVLISVLRADRSVAKIIAAVSGVAAGAMSFAGWLQPKWVEEGAGLVFGLGTTYLIVVYMTLFAAVVLIAYYLQGEASIEQQPHQDI